MAPYLLVNDIVEKDKNVKNYIDNRQQCLICHEVNTIMKLPDCLAEHALCFKCYFKVNTCPVCRRCIK